MAGGLSYEQGPALAAPLGLFLLAPLFLMLAAVAALALPDWLTGRWSSATLALTHLLTLGYLGAVMQGALLQMVPVVLGAPIPRAGAIARCGLIGLGLGAPLLAAGLLRGEPVWLTAALCALVLAWLPFLIGLGFALARSLADSEMNWPLRQAGLALLVTAASGLYLVGALAGFLVMPDLLLAADLHAAWGLFGWLLILVVGVAYQVVPMLQITPAYPRRLSRGLTWLLPLALLAYSLGRMVDFGSAVAALIAAAGGMAFALATLSVQRRRRRKLADVTLDFWRLGMAALIAAMLLFVLLDFLPDSHRPAAELSLGLLFLLGFAASVVNGMLYKIVPFLAWFHLQSQTGARAGTIPNMRDMIPEPAMRRHFRLHLAAVCLLVPAPFLPAWAATPGLLALLAGGHLLWLNLRRARGRFLAYGGRL